MADKSPPSEQSELPAVATGRQTIPGTVYLVDAQQRLRAKHSSKHQDVVLVPAPSDDPDDPLNWSPRRKALSTACTCVYTLMVGLTSAAIYSVLVPISGDTGISVNQLNQGTGYLFLLFGWGCLFWQPLALQYGKRPVYLITLLATMAIMIWQPYTKTPGQYLASKILQGFFGAPIESLCEISMADIYFQHERGTYVGLYAFMLAGSNFLAPLISGFINDGQGWQWVFYWCAIFCGIGFVFCFFFMEETNYSRHPSHNSTASQSPDSERPNLSDKNGDDFEKEGFSDRSITPPVDSSSNKAYKKKTFLQKMSVLPERKPFVLWKTMYRPLMLISLPAIAFSGFSYGSNLIWFNVLNGTASSFLSSSPYDFRPSFVGLAYVSPLIGVTLASAWAGRAGDWIVLKLARRNNGVLESEHRLWLFSVAALLVPFGLLLWGVGFAHQVHWFGLVFAMGVIAATNTMAIQLTVSYAIDSYKDLSGEAMAGVIVIRNTMSFAIGYAITPWVDGMGPQNAFIVAAFAGMAQILTFLPMIKFGKQLRVKNMDRYYRYVEQSKALGLVH